MSRRKWIRIAAAAMSAALLLVLAACAELPPPEVQPTESEGMSGGAAELPETANLREISVEMQGGMTVVHMHFINGSRNAAMEESKLSEVPTYAVTQLYDPARIQIALRIGFADYASTGTVFADSVVDGIFGCPSPESGMQLLYLQLSAPVSVQSRAEGSVLTLELTPRSVAARTAWYVGLNAMSAFERGDIPDALGFAPTMCDGFANQILISRPLADEQEAEELKERALSEVGSSVSPDAFYVFSMRTDELPPYESMGSRAIASSLPVISREGEPENLPVLIEDGTWLTQTEAGVIYYAVPYVPGEGSDAEDVVKQQLWMQSGTRSGSPVLSERFYDIRHAAVSYDGRYVGILDARAESQLLFVYDMQTGELMNLGEEGFGDYTVSFLWMPNTDVIYAMSGTATSMQLLKYDFNLAAGSPRVESVEERSGAEAAISYAGGRIYFADQIDMTVYAVDLRSGQRQTLGSGIDCAISPDGRTLAVLQMRLLNDIDMVFDLVLMDPATGAVTQTVQENTEVEAFMFAPDSDRLLYTTHAAAEVSEDYPFALFSYVPGADPQLLCTSRTERIEVSPVPDLLYFIYVFTTGQETRTLRPITYYWELGPAGESS